MKIAPFVAEASFHVRYAETDAMGIVHHAAYIVWFEEGRSNYMRQRGTSYADFERDGYYMAVTEVHARYLKPARYDDRVTIRCWLGAARSRSMTFEYEVVHDASGELLMSGSSHHICINKQGAVTKIPSQWLRWFED